ncbi:MAG: vitamin B12-dependent ribonucleotide reductase [Bradymonadaceae bacterium]|nr:vitamin B12-dependent ribonucleotide reductase [Lujinxingiaceae bacterium]
MTTSIEPTLPESSTSTAKPKVRKFKGSEQGLRFERFFTVDGAHPYDGVEWERRTASIGSETGKLVFEQKDVEVPAHWSQMATNVVVSKYFRGQLNTAQRETSVRQLLDRVTNAITEWGIASGYFASGVDAEIYRHELLFLLLHQKMAFNSPVWFNVGVETKPQASACFINSVSDTMDSILSLAKTEGMLFKWGSGTGSNLSPIRSSREQLSGGGEASGPVSFMKGYDAFAGVIKSGGKTRRAAKMVILNTDHPDITDFIKSKSDEEKKAWALIDAGYDGGFNVPGGAYDSVFFQNANHSVRATDDFMRAVEQDGPWSTRAVSDGRVVETHKAREMMNGIAEAAWICGDPGMQYDTTINAWHTCSNTDRINASNPCSEYMFLDDSACNLASLNLMTFRDAEGEFDVESFKRAVELTITAQEIMVSNASYPTAAIEKNSHVFRPLGLGYANLGALLMARGLPYDSDEGRAFAGAITALMCGEAYRQSAAIAETTGPFTGYPINEEPMLRVIAKHREQVDKIADEWTALTNHPLVIAARNCWDQALELGARVGYRNSQVTVLAPTGTIGFMMDCDTTGIEPDIALIKYKKLVGGGYFKIVNQTVPEALHCLGYSDKERKAILEFLMENDTIEGAPALRNEHLAVFDCAFEPSNGSRSIAPMGHVRMMSAAQPFLSGAISKTVNMPPEATVEEIARIYVDAWKLGLKAIAIYRDGCKRTQPLSTKNEEVGSSVLAASAPAVDYTGRRRRLPDERPSITHKFSIAGHEGYITVGMYDGGQPGEVFIVMSKEGSVVSGLMDSFATSISLGLQYGVPLQVMVDKFSHTRFEPSGMTNNPRIRIAKSVIDYIFRWLADKFLAEEERNAYLAPAPEPWQPGPKDEGLVETPKAGPKVNFEISSTGNGEAKGNGFAKAREGQVLFDATKTGNSVFTLQADAPPCSDCGSIMIRAGACYKCTNCGGTSGCS